MPQSTVCLSFDFDALSVWFGYEKTTPAMLNRGEYGARVGVPRVLDLLDRHGLRAPGGRAPVHALYLSDLPAAFAGTAERFLGRELPPVEVVTVSR